MYIRVDEEAFVNCDGRFEVRLTLHAENANAPVNLRMSTQHVVDIQNLALDHGTVTLDPGDRHVVRLTGGLTKRCKGGEFSFGWDETTGGNPIPGTHDDVLIAVPRVPFKADDDPDPVVAAPSGAFLYTVKLGCCTNGVPAQQRNVDYRITAWTGVKRFRTVPPGPVTLDCPDEERVIDVMGILEEPNRPGEIRITVAGVGRCSVVTKIGPNPTPNRTAHRNALDEWE
jgi:hypothetical protein